MGYDAMPQILNDSERLQMLAGCTTPRERHALGGDLLRMDALLETRAVNPGRLTRLDRNQCMQLDGVAERFRAARRRRNAWIFADIIQESLQLLAAHADVAQYYRDWFKAVLVDEYQDTNPLQIELLNAIRAPQAHLFAVGDDDQAIYAFRGADTAPIHGFCEHFAGASICKLEVNYRSTRAILTAANGVFRDKPAAYRKVLRTGPQGVEGERPVKRRFSSQPDMFEWVLRTCRELEQLHAIPVASMAALFRLNETREAAEEFFRQQVAAAGQSPACLTVHGSKGLEFPVVFLCDLDDGVFPSYRIPRGRQGLAGLLHLLRRAPVEGDLEEEQRLFYVGITRAQKQLYLLSAARRSVHGVTKRFRPSRFLRLVAGPLRR
jgi:superfamily I DNA/RNA helicase